MGLYGGSRALHGPAPQSSSPIHPVSSPDALDSPRPPPSTPVSSPAAGADLHPILRSKVAPAFSCFHRIIAHRLGLGLEFRLLARRLRRSPSCEQRWRPASSCFRRIVARRLE
uniref:Uncharacterized protein n=1 Tax=Oryza punctata TaxID=4537 RepID=A0A0E0JZ64_ORYPU